jgi:hypothetical protein
MNFLTFTKTKMMNRLRYCVVALLLCCLAGCYEVNEEITIDDKGAGTYLTKMDMSALLQMMQTMTSEEEMTKNGLDRAIDTTISLKTVLDSSQTATADQKRLFNDGTMKLKLNVKETVLKADINFPFKSSGDLQSLMSGSSTAGLAQVFKKVFAAPGSESASAMPDQGLDQISNVFDVTVTNGSIVKKLNDAKYKALMDKPEIAQARQMIGNGFEVLYTTTIKLPRPAKKTDNPLIKLSDDKKTVTMKYDLMKLFDTPEKFSYSIYY